MTGASRDPWRNLGAWTMARIALGRAGASLPTREVLSFALAHAQARDAVLARLDRRELAGRLHQLGLDTIDVESRAPDRTTFLRRPDLGRRLDEASVERITHAAQGRSFDLVLVVGDGLSATAVTAHAAVLAGALLPHIAALGLTLGPVAIAEGARVALGDEVGALLDARLVAVMMASVRASRLLTALACISRLRHASAAQMPNATVSRTSAQPVWRPPPLPLISRGL